MALGVINVKVAILAIGNLQSEHPVIKPRMHKCQHRKIQIKDDAVAIIIFFCHSPEWSIDSPKVIF